MLFTILALTLKVLFGGGMLLFVVGFLLLFCSVSKPVNSTERARYRVPGIITFGAALGFWAVGYIMFGLLGAGPLLVLGALSLYFSQSVIRQGLAERRAEASKSTATPDR